MKCKHKNFTLYEYTTVSTSFQFEDGNPPEDGIGWHSDPAPTGEISVTCEDCGFNKKYGHHTRAPKWIQDAWEKLMEEQNLWLTKGEKS